MKRKRKTTGRVGTALRRLLVLAGLLLGVIWLLNNIQLWF